MSFNNDDVLDDWEDFDETSLNTKLDKLKKESTKMNASPSSQTTTTSSSSALSAQPSVTNPLHGIAQQNGKAPIRMMLMHHNDEDYRTQYGPPEPTVKILKRPTLDGANKTAADMKPKAPMKTLQQREHEYAQARLRIMGSAQSPEDSADIIIKQNGLMCGQTQPASNYNLTNGSSSGETSLPTQPYQQNNLQLQQHNNNNNNNNLLQQQRPQDGIIRLPRGPNGSTGFMIRR